MPLIFFSFELYSIADDEKWGNIFFLIHEKMGTEGWNPVLD